MMSQLNSVIIEGNLVRDPQIKTIPSGKQVCTFAVASNRFYKVNEQASKEVSFIDVETWSKLAIACGDVLRKGRGVRVVGRLKQDRWEDQAGKNYSRLKIVAEHVEFKPIIKKDDDSVSRFSNSEKEEEVAEAVF